MDACTHTHYVLYNRAYFAGLIFAVRNHLWKEWKLDLLKILPLYGIQLLWFSIIENQKMVGDNTINTTQIVMIFHD